MLEHPSIRRYSSSLPHPFYRVNDVDSENPSGADNQQETASPRIELDPHWITGFVDGEGCFSVSIHKNPLATKSRGWQVHPVFHVYQHESYRAVLEALVRHFGVGNLRPKGPNSSVLTYAVDSLLRLEQAIIPFFERYPLVVKARDFATFADIIRRMRRREHWTDDGFERIVRLAYTMNMYGKQRARTLEQILAGSSETACQGAR